jgi:DnaJ-class molecular chaperone
MAKRRIDPRDHITVTLYSGTSDKEHQVSFPALWAICPECDGCATDRGASVECDGGGFTASEWHDLDEDFREEYLAGRYDRPCGYCDGKGRIQEVDTAKLGRWQQKLHRYYRAQQRDFAEIDAVMAAERRMGA